MHGNLHAMVTVTTKRDHGGHPRSIEIGPGRVFPPGPGALTVWHRVTRLPVACQWGSALTADGA